MEFWNEKSTFARVFLNCVSYRRRVRLFFLAVNLLRRLCKCLYWILKYSYHTPCGKPLQKIAFLKKKGKKPESADTFRGDRNLNYLKKNFYWNKKYLLQASKTYSVHPKFFLDKTGIFFSPSLFSFKNLNQHQYCVGQEKQCLRNISQEIEVAGSINTPAQPFSHFDQCQAMRWASELNVVMQQQLHNTSGNSRPAIMWHWCWGNLYAHYKEIENYFQKVKDRETLVWTEQCW